MPGLVAGKWDEPEAEKGKVMEWARALAGDLAPFSDKTYGLLPRSNNECETTSAEVGSLSGFPMNGCTLSFFGCEAAPGGRQCLVASREESMSSRCMHPGIQAHTDLYQPYV